MKKLFILITAVFIFSGCATTLSQSAARIRSANTKMVSSCQFVGELYSFSGWGIWGGSNELIKVRNDAIETAASMGATHIVWTGIGYGGNGTYSYASGKAYHCR